MSKDVYVLAEQRDGNIQKVAFELVGEARQSLLKTLTNRLLQFF